MKQSIAYVWCGGPLSCAGRFSFFSLTRVVVSHPVSVLPDWSAWPFPVRLVSGARLCPCCAAASAAAAFAAAASAAASAAATAAAAAAAAAAATLPVGGACYFSQMAVSDWPSSTPLYTWRALRLLGRENPANLLGCYDGDLVKV